MDTALSWADHRIFKDSGEHFIFAVEDASLFSLTREARETLSRWRSSKSIDLDKIPSPDLEILEGLRDAQLLLPVSREKAMASQLEAGHVPLSTLVLEVAQDCNLRCTYCYADGGTYGSVPCLLSPETARAAVRYLLDCSGDRSHVNLIFFGGEPLLNMQAVKVATSEAKTYGRKLDKKVHLSLTTNGTLLDPEIVAFLHANQISVAVSMDGPRDIHDHNRPYESGNGSYREIVSRLGLLLEDAPVPVAARVTLAPDHWHRVVEVFDHLTGLGFHEVGIAPVSPVNRNLIPTAGQEKALLESFKRLGRRFVAHARKGRVMPF